MRKILAFISIILLVMGLFVFEAFCSEPPTPNVTAKCTKVPTTQGSFCWDGLFSVKCVDKFYTSQLDMGKNYNPTKVFPNEKIKIVF